MSKRLFSPFSPSICASCHRRIFTRSFSNTVRRASDKPSPSKNSGNDADVAGRIQQLGGKANLESYYPRLPQSPNNLAMMSAAYFSGNFGKEAKQQSAHGEAINTLVTVYGRVTSIREHGSKLSFISLYTPGDHSSRTIEAQAVLSFSRIGKNREDVTLQNFKKFRKTVQRGDWIAVKGHAGETDSGHWSVMATEIPQVLSPSLKTVPARLEDVEVRMHNRHIDHIVNPSSLDVLFLRHTIISSLRQFFVDRKFVEVSTPLLVADAGGASARPFETSSRDMPGVNIRLRIATELFLKRLIVGGMQKIFEIGPIFRNEGVDHSHNPEFTMCEFYATMTSLGDLMAITEDLFRHLAKVTNQPRIELQESPLEIDFDKPFAILDFIPSLEKTIREKIPDWSFPNLSNPDATQRLIKAIEAFNIPLPASYNNVTGLLDTLSSHLLESQCKQPTFIIHYPECMSPLSKSFELSHNGITHRVSARAELFIDGSEYVNLYEEENSPIEQRRKFVSQLEESAGEERRTVDENYLQTMEWGLPPTGGWGAGIDRIVMLFSGKKRIADVLAFGTLRNVLGLGSNEKNGDQ